MIEMLAYLWMGHRNGYGWPRSAGEGGGHPGPEGLTQGIPGGAPWQQALLAAWEQGLRVLGWQTLNPSSCTHQDRWATNEAESVKTCPSSPRLSDWLTSARTHPEFREKQPTVPDGKKFHPGKNTKNVPAASHVSCFKDPQRRGPHALSFRLVCTRACASAAGSAVLKGVPDFKRSRSSSYQKQKSMGSQSWAPATLGRACSSHRGC